MLLRFLHLIDRPSDFYFLRNKFGNYSNGSPIGNFVLPFKQVIGHLELSSNPGLVMLSIPHLGRTGTMKLSNNTDLRVFNSSMTTLEATSVDANPAARLTLPQLPSLGGSSTFSNLLSVDLTSLRNTTEPGDLKVTRDFLEPKHLDGGERSHQLHGSLDYHQPIGCESEQLEIPLDDDGAVDVV